MSPSTSLTSKTSLCSTSPTPPKSSTTPISTYASRDLSHAPLTSKTLDPATQPTTEALSIKVQDRKGGSAPAFLHLSPNHSSTHPPSTAAILLSGAGGGVVGPSGIYPSIGDKLSSLSAAIPVLRMDYRYPARTAPCSADVVAGMDYMEDLFGIRRFCLVGWSFGSAPVFSTAARDERVVGCATIAGQTAETEGIRQLAGKGVPVLLMHGTGDRVLSPWCSQKLYDMYGAAKGGERTLRLFEGDDHALTQSAAEADKLICEFVVKCAGAVVEGGEEGVLRETLVAGGEGERVEVMKKGGDLRGEERVE